MMKMIALRTIVYAGREYRLVEVFEAKDIDAHRFEKFGEAIKSLACKTSDQ